MATFTVRERATGLEFKNAEMLLRSLKRIGEADQISFWVLGFDRRNREILRACVMQGGINGLFTDPKIIFRRILTAGCCAWVAVHNHPDGSNQPSDKDLELAFMLNAASNLMDLMMMDYIIVGEEGYLSFAEQGFMTWKERKEHSRSRFEGKLINLEAWKNRKGVDLWT